MACQVGVVLLVTAVGVSLDATGKGEMGYELCFLDHVVGAVRKFATSRATACCAGPFNFRCIAAPNVFR